MDGKSIDTFRHICHCFSILLWVSLYQITTRVYLWAFIISLLVYHNSFTRVWSTPVSVFISDDEIELLFWDQHLIDIIFVKLRFKVDLKRSVYSNGVNVGLDLLEITSENSFFLYKVFQDPPESPNISKSLPLINGSYIDGSLLSDLAEHFIRVYASLWSSPSPIIRTHGENVINNHLGGNLKYVSVHKVLKSVLFDFTYTNRDILMFPW